jgi:hypothetical protein
MDRWTVPASAVSVLRSFGLSVFRSLDLFPQRLALALRSNDVQNCIPFLVPKVATPERHRFRGVSP